MASSVITRKGWIWIFAILVVFIILVFFIVKAKAQTPNKTGITDNRSKLSTICCGKISDCYYGFSKTKMENLQTELNNKGCKDYNGDSLLVDGVCGPKTNSSIKNCINK